ncbi:PREDICTED: uncharacterized protein LOC106104485 [Papilio polytes]|uniref:uncharacterized protein LOC106104485 n=1 Tax=Papilio polytes TaxID=76194 RepID=UPI00067687F4|nr:PREDICTED: uncharacterized protein LOC106104485 [Papilio polytes]
MLIFVNKFSIDKNVAVKAETNGNREQAEDDALINFNTPQATKSKQKQNVENNNVPRTPFSPSPTEDYKDLNLADMTSEEIQEYLIKKFQSIKFLNDQSDDDSQPFYQNRQAFPDIPLLDSEFTDTELVNLLTTQLAQDGSCSAEEASALALALGMGNFQISSESSSSSSKDTSSECSSDEGHPYIMPLSHSIAVKARGQNGRMQLIVPVSPTGSVKNVSGAKNAAPGGASSVPVAGSSPASPITRTTSEKVSNRSELMASIREKWTRHTTK